MTNLSVDEKLAERLQNIAERENRPVDDVLKNALDKYEAMAPSQLDEAAAYEAAMRELRPKLYARARRYWQEVGDTARLALTDEQLDEQFWLFDNDGIPRLKSEQDSVVLKPDPFLMITEMADSLGLSSGRSDIGERSREILDHDYPQYLKRRMHERDTDAE